MAVRTRVWQRGQTGNFEFRAASFATATLNFPAGSTLIRLHYSYQFEAHQDVPFDQLPVAQIVLGTILLDGNPPPSPPNPISDPVEDYLWYEGVQVRTTQHTVIAPTFATMDGPTDGGHRDIRAQRLFAHDFPILAWTYDQQNVASFSSIYQLQVTYSALIETAP